MIKDHLKRGLQAFGYNVTNTASLGVNLEFDLARITSEKPLATIFDVGGNFGQTALRFASAFPPAKVFTFEPVPSSFERLLSAIADHKNIQGHNLAFGDQPGTARLNLTSSAGTNTLVATAATIDSIDVRVDTLDAFAAAQGIGTIDLLKIDVEGFELQVLKGATDLLTRGHIRFIFVECVFAPDPDFNHTSFFDLRDVLLPHGFCFVGYYAEAFTLRTGCAHGNVLFAHTPQLPAKVPPGPVHNIL